MANMIELNPNAFCVMFVLMQIASVLAISTEVFHRVPPLYIFPRVEAPAQCQNKKTTKKTAFVA